MRFSEIKCENGAIVESNIRIISQAIIAACPHYIMVPEHYREDGTCKCDDPEHQEMMIREWGYTREDFEC